MIEVLVSSGESLGLVLLVGLVTWGLCDALVWAIGEQTFSQWVIKESKKRLSFTLAALCIIVGGAWWLVDHFELLPIFRCHLFLNHCNEIRMP